MQLDYLSRICAWDAMMEGVASKVSLAELSTTHNAARVQALLALAAMKVGRRDWQDYLRRRVELLAEVNELVQERPILADLWHDTSRPSESTESKGE